MVQIDLRTPGGAAGSGLYVLAQRHLTIHCPPVGLKRVERNRRKQCGDEEARDRGRDEERKGGRKVEMEGGTEGGTEGRREVE